MPEVYLPAGKGSLQVEMLAAARRHGLVSYQLAPSAADLLREVAAGNPVIVLQNLGFTSDSWHYAVVVGYDYSWGKIYLRSGEDERDVMSFFIHEFTWMRSGYWAMVALPPDRIPETADQDRWLAAVAALEHAGDVRGARTGYQAFMKRWPSNVNGAIGLANTYYAKSANLPYFGQGFVYLGTQLIGGGLAGALPLFCSGAYARRRTLLGSYALRRKARRPLCCGGGRHQAIDREEARPLAQPDPFRRGAAAAGSRAPRRRGASSPPPPRGWCRRQ